MLPISPAGTIINNIAELDNFDVNQQEENSTDSPADNDTGEGQPDLSESIANADRESEVNDSTSAEPVDSSSQTAPEINHQTHQDNTDTHWMCTRSKVGIHKPKQPYIGLAEAYRDDKEPENVKEALIKPKWKAAMDAEFKALMSNQTWTLVPLQGQENIIDSKWIFKTKYKADGSIERRKARLVARGFQQTADLDFDETFSHVVKSSSVRIILAIAVHLNWEVRQLDINNAFLNGSLKETVFMYQPEGYIDSTKPNHICKLSKVIYGL